MINSRSLNDLHPKVAVLARKFLNACKREGIEILVTSTYRDFESQNALYAQGRTKPGSIITNAKAGDSYHNWRVAFDVVPLRNGKPVWNTRELDGLLWSTVGRIGEQCGLEWAGHWKRFKEFPHFQYTGGLSLADFKSGLTLGDK